MTDVPNYDCQPVVVWISGSPHADHKRCNHSHRRNGFGLEYEEDSNKIKNGECE